MQSINNFLQLYLLLVFFFCASFGTTVLIDYTEQTLFDDKFSKKTSLLFIGEIVLQLTLTAFIMYYLPIELLSINKSTFNGTLHSDLVQLSAVIYAVLTVAFDSNITGKISLLKQRFNESMASTVPEDD